MMPRPLRRAKRPDAAAPTNQFKRGEEDGRKRWLDKSAEENAGEEDQIQTASFTPVSSRR
jgi:hypothetical protein